VHHIDAQVAVVRGMGPQTAQELLVGHYLPACWRAI
jgi:hypothetical protein